MPDETSGGLGTSPAPPSRSVLEAGLRHVLRALRPYLGELVLIGGWVPYLHRHYGAISRWEAGLSFTSELDVLVAERPLPAGGRPSPPPPSGDDDPEGDAL